MPKGIPKSGINKGWIKKGQKMSVETRAKMNKDKIGIKRPPFSLEWKEKLSQSKKGKKHSEQHKDNMSDAQVKRYDRVGRKKYNRSYHLIDRKYRQWRSDVFSRDNWTCQTCGIRGVYLEAHHIKSWARYPELRLDLQNGATLCRECHKLTENYKNKK